MSWGDPAVERRDRPTPTHSATFTVGNGTTVAVVPGEPHDAGEDRVLGDEVGDRGRRAFGSELLRVHGELQLHRQSRVRTSGSLTLSKNNPTASVGDGHPVRHRGDALGGGPSGAPADVSWLTPKFTGDVTDNNDGTATFVAGMSSRGDRPREPDRTAGRRSADLEAVTGSALGSVPSGFDFTVHYSVRVDLG